MVNENIAVRMKEIVKLFPRIVANDHINFEVREGEVCALLGENGAGKTTLMNVLYGLYEPDEGEIYVWGKKCRFKSPRDAQKLGIGMVHQQLMLIPSFTVVENIALGASLSPQVVKEEVKQLLEKYGFELDPDTEVWRLSMGERQKVEIIKALYRGGKILILDEPTTILTPQETSELFKVIRSMAKEGFAVVFITHKLNEVFEVCNRVTILRKGTVIATKNVEDINRQEIVKMMFEGRQMLAQASEITSGIKNSKGNKVLEVQHLYALNDKGLIALRDFSFYLCKGEILGVAGISGNGQRELVEVIMGLRKVSSGKVLIDGRDLTNSSPRKIIDENVACIYEDMMSAIVPNFAVSENLILGRHFVYPFIRRTRSIGKSIFTLLNGEEIRSYSEELVKTYDIVTPNVETLVRNLSGGNKKRLLLAREISKDSNLLIAAYPTSGLDVSASEFVHRKLLEQREKGTAILFISEDLDEILSFSDRIMVMHNGENMGTVPRDKASTEDIGLMMLGKKKSGEGPT